MAQCICAHSGGWLSPKYVDLDEAELRFLAFLILEPPELEDVGVSLIHIDLVEETFNVSAQRDSVLSEAENDPQQAV